MVVCEEVNAHSFRHACGVPPPSMREAEGAKNKIDPQRGDYPLKKFGLMLLMPLLLLLSGCTGGQEISGLFVIAMAVDAAPEGNLTVTVKALSGTEDGASGRVRISAKAHPIRRPSLKRPNRAISS